MRASFDRSISYGLKLEALLKMFCSLQLIEVGKQEVTHF